MGSERINKVSVFGLSLLYTVCLPQELFLLSYLFHGRAESGSFAVTTAGKLVLGDWVRGTHPPPPAPARYMGPAVQQGFASLLRAPN